MHQTQRVHLCEFCSARFHPRAQVKNPRACNRPDCQKKRQKSNELAWREKNKTSSDPEYHRVRKRARLKKLRQISESIGRCLKTGATFLSLPGLGESVQDFLFLFLLSLGIRRVNKFWPETLFNPTPELREGF